MAKDPAKILLVEDESSLNQAYTMILESAGYEVHSAFNGKEALKITETIEPDLIFLDLRMPSMDGVEFLKNYNLKEDHPNVKVIIFSNLDTQKKIDEAYDLGAHKYILKAWATPKEIKKIAENILAGK